MPVKLCVPVSVRSSVWTVPDFSTLSRRQKTLAVNIPYRGSQGPIHLLVDSTGIKVEGEGEWHARKHGGPKRRPPLSLGPMARPWLAAQDPSRDRRTNAGGSGARDYWKPHRRRAGVARSSGPDPARPGDRQRDRRRCLRYPQASRCHRGSRCPCRHPATQKRQTLEASHGRRHRAQRGSAGIEIPRPRELAKLEWIPPPEPGGDKDELHETFGPAAHGTGLRPAGRRAPSRYRHHERLYRTRHTCHENCGITVSGERAASVSSCFVQHV